MHHYMGMYNIDNDILVSQPEETRTSTPINLFGYSLYALHLQGFDANIDQPWTPDLSLKLKLAMDPL